MLCGFRYSIGEIMLNIPPEDDFKVGDLVRFLNQIDNNELYGVIIDFNERHSLDYPYCIRLACGHKIWMSEWDLEKVA